MPIASIIGGMIGQQGALASGNAAGAAGVDAFQRSQTEAARNRANASPWTNVGSEAVNKLAQLYGLGHLDHGETDPTFGGRALVTSDVAGDRTNALRDFQASPGYQWRLDQGTKALDRTAAAKGMLLSGAQAKGISDYGQNQASQEFGNYTNALSGLSGGGMTATLGTDNTNAGIFNAGNALNMQGDMGRASSYSNAANALASGIGKGVQNAFSLASFGMPGLGGFARV